MTELCPDYKLGHTRTDSPFAPLFHQLQWLGFAGGVDKRMVLSAKPARNRPNLQHRVGEVLLVIPNLQNLKRGESTSWPYEE